MELTPTLLQVEFDQFQRYGAVAVLLKPLLARLGRPARVLEVGCNILHLLPDFLAPLPVEVVRADVEDHSANGTPFVMLPREGPLPFGDDAFDFTVALEVLEHVPAEDRAFLVGEWARVSREGLVLSVPNGQKAVRRSERRADRAYRVRHGKPHPWLAEHEAFGVPTKAEMQGVFEKLGLAARAFGNAPLAEWLPLFLVTQELGETGSPELVAMFQRLLNVRAFKAFTRERPYRRLYAAFKTDDQARAATACWHAGGVTFPPRGRAAREQVVDPVASLAGAYRALVQQVGSTRREPALERSLREARFHVDALERELRLQEWAMEQAKAGAPAWWRRSRTRFTGQTLDPSQTTTRALRPLPDLGPAHWEALDDDPQWTLHRPFPAGWARVRVRGRFPSGSISKLYPDYGHGMAEETCYVLGTWAGPEEMTAYVYFHHPVVKLRFDPLTEPRPFRLDHFGVTPCGAWRVGLAGFWRNNGGLRAAWRREGWRGAVQHLLANGAAPVVPDKCVPRPPDYATWAEAHQLTAAQRNALAARLGALAAPPTLTLLLPLDPTATGGEVARTLRSLDGQPYPHWNLALAAPEEMVPRLRVQLGTLPALRDRTRFITAPYDADAAARLNRLLDQTAADFVIPLTVGDQVASDALLLLADAIARQPAADCFYSDEDYWHPDRGRHGPRFKPGWSPEAFFAMPYLGRLTAYRASTVRALGGFLPGCAGAHEVDLVIRLAAGRQDNVVHVPHVLCHRAGDGDAPMVPDHATARVLARHMAKSTWGFTGAIDTGVSPFRVRPALTGQPLVSIIIPSAGRAAQVRGRATTHIGHCLKTLRDRTTYPNYEITVVSNGLLDGPVEKELAKYGVRRITLLQPFNFAANLNAAARRVEGEYLLFLNDDTEVITPAWLEEMLRYGMVPGVGAVGAKLFFPDGRLQHVGVHLYAPGPGHPGYGSPGDAPGPLGCATLPRNYLAVTGACLLTPRALFESVGGFDEGFPLNYNDVDYCLKVHAAGRRIVFTPDAELYHFEKVRRDGRDRWKQWELDRFRRLWSAHFPADPYLNANLDPNATDWRLRR